MFSGSRIIPTLGSTVQWETRQAFFPTGTVGPRVGIFLSPLNTNGGFYLTYMNTQDGLLYSSSYLACHWQSPWDIIRPLYTSIQYDCNLWLPFPNAWWCWRQSMFGTQCYPLLTKRFEMCDITPGESYRRLLVRATINIQTLGDLTNPSVLWLKYHINTTNTVSLGFNVIFFAFFLLSKMTMVNFLMIESQFV